MYSANRKKRVVVCFGAYCNLGRRADKLYKKLQPLLDEINDGQFPPPVKLEIAQCLNMCGHGPNLVIYPDDIVLNKVDESQIEEIVGKYLK